MESIFTVFFQFTVRKDGADRDRRWEVERVLISSRSIQHNKMNNFNVLIEFSIQGQ